MKQIKVLLVALFFVLLPVSAVALVIKGVNIPEQVTQAGSQQQLVLNGAGVRGKFIFDIYIGALYLSEPSDNAGQILADRSPKRVMMHFLYDKIEQDKMQSAWIEGFEDNLDEKAFEALKSEINAFNAAFGDTVEGDVVIVDFLADATTQVNINGVEKAQIRSVDFQRALLSVWLGDSPVDGSLKSAMLGQD